MVTVKGIALSGQVLKTFPPPPAAAQLCCPTHEGTLILVEPSPGTRHCAKHSMGVFSLHPCSHSMR